VALGTAVAGAWDATVTAVVVGCVAHGLGRSLAIEIAPGGLTRGLCLNGGFLGPTTTMSWPAIAEIRTEWCRPGDDTAMQTVVRHRDGATIRFSTAMGIARYRRCLGEIADRALGARRSGLTDAILAEPPAGRRETLAAAATAAALGLTLVALVGLHYVWAQGPSTLARYQDPASPAAVPGAPCDGTLLVRRSEADGAEVAGPPCP
jgi:hypothetical protein